MPISGLSINDVLPLGIALLDRSLNVISWNATLNRWSGVCAEDAIGKSLQEIFPSLAIEPLQHRLVSVFEDGQSVIFSPSMHRRLLPLTTSSGDPLLHKAHFSPRGKHQTLLVLEDVTSNFRQLDKLRAERRRLKESEASLEIERQRLVSKNKAIVEARHKAEEANRAKSDFLASMSHEIRTPITAIHGFATILHERLTDPASQDAAKTIMRNSDHLTNLVNDILDLSKIEAGKLILIHEPCSPCEIAMQAVKIQSARAKAKGIALTFEMEANTPSRIQTDPLRLRQTLFNLVGNAVKFTEKGSITVKVQTNDQKDQLEFIITDTGIGIGEENLESIFDPFIQEDTSMQRRFGGTGLGLAICRKLVDRLGGMLTVSSQVGIGSEFRVTLPIDSEQGDQQTVASNQLDFEVSQATHESKDASAIKPVNHSLKGLRILVAEDGVDNQKLIRYLLEKFGAEFRMVANGKLAIEALQNTTSDWQPDLLLLDMQMPIMDGYTTASVLRAEGNEIPIIALTAHAMEGDRERAIEAGCDDYTTKPINMDGLISLILQTIKKTNKQVAEPNC